MKQVYCVFKPLGWSCLQALERLQELKQELAGEALTYAGRLDPLAEGVLVVLVNADNETKQQYLHLNKQYQFDVVMGVSADSYDVLGIPTLGGDDRELSEEAVRMVLSEFEGEYEQAYPAFSGRKVQGKPLWWWAKEQRLDEVEIPTRSVVVKRLSLQYLMRVSSEELLRMVEWNVSQVSGKFRQNTVLQQWSELLGAKDSVQWSIARLRCDCGSGVYVRDIANRLGDRLGVGGCSLRIMRTKVGDFTTNDCVILHE